MKFLDADFSGSIQISGSLTIPKGTADQRPVNPETGSLFLELSNSGSNIKIYNGQSGSGWEIAGLNKNAIRRTFGTPKADIEYLVIAGGGAGGRRSSSGTYYQGGGGAGGFLSASLSSIESGSSITVTVGAGGAEYSGGSTFGFGSSGGDSSIVSSTGTSFTTVTSTGGGRGATIDHPSSDAAVTNQDGADGGSGGGASGWGSTTSTGGSGTTGQGNNGGNGVAGTDAAGCGGGGAGGAGTSNSGTGGRDGGDGGAGKQSSITGTSTYYSAGAGGGRGYSSVAGAEGSDGTGYRGENNSGDGGQPGIPVRAYTNTAGHSGVVILAYDSGSINAIGGQEGDAGNGRKYHKFNSSGTFYTGTTTDFQIVTEGLHIHFDAANTDSYAGTGTSVTDLTGNGQTGTFYGDTSFINTHGGGFSFDGAGGDYISWTNSGTDNIFCIDVWFDNDDDITSAIIDGPYQVMLTACGTYHHGGFALGAWTGAATNETVIFYTNGGASTRGTYIRDSITSGIHNMVANWNGTSYDIWVDGSKKTTYNMSGGHSTQQALSGAGRLGGEPGGNGYDFDGSIHNFKLYTSSLTDAQVTQNYNALKNRFGV